MKLLILCTGNSCRSQMAEGWFRKMAADMNLPLEVVSAGVEKHGLNPRAVQVMQEAGVPIGHHTSDLVDQYLNKGISHVITVCDSARERCPLFPEATHLVHHSFPDPARAGGSEAEVIRVFREVRDKIAVYAQNYLRQNFS